MTTRRNRLSYAQHRANLEALARREPETTFEVIRTRAEMEASFEVLRKADRQSAICALIGLALAAVAVWYVRFN
jgi:hypothetical protein